MWSIINLVSVYCYSFYCFTYVLTMILCKKVISKFHKLDKLYFNTKFFVYKCILVGHYNKILLLLLLLLLCITVITDKGTLPTITYCLTCI